MIKSSALTNLLKKAIENGIDTIFICNKSGDLLCIEGNENNPTLNDVISSMWMGYESNNDSPLKDEKLKYLLIENEDSNVIMTNIYDYIICMKSNKDMKLGMLKRHLESLTDNLNKLMTPFKDVLEKREENIKNEDNE